MFAWEVYAFFDFVDKLDKVKTAVQFNTLTAATVISALVGLTPAAELSAVITALQYSFLILFGIFKFGIL